MRTTLRSIVALTAACALQVSNASEAEAPTGALAYRPAPRSTLVAGRELNFLVAQWQRGAELTTVLARQQSGAAPHPVARVVQIRQGPELLVAIHPLHERRSAATRADHEIASLEQLYALILRLEPEARYCLGAGRRPCNPARDGVSHAQVLTALAHARGRAVVGTPLVAPWRVVAMRETPTRSSDPDVVGIRATAYEAPVEGVAIYFNRAPHATCFARTGADGVAVCRLVDQHGDEDEHDDAASVVATFPGDVRTDRVLLPTTYVLPSKP
jgi:hypothetical protein